MDKAIVVTVQQQMRVFEKQEDYQEDIFRYMRMAKAKQANLVIFPALSPVMLVPPIVSSPRLGLMKQAEKGRGPLPLRPADKKGPVQVRCRINTPFPPGAGKARALPEGMEFF